MSLLLKRFSVHYARCNNNSGRYANFCDVTQIKRSYGNLIQNSTQFLTIPVQFNLNCDSVGLITQQLMFNEGMQQFIHSGLVISAL